MKTYTTISGDSFDKISYEQLGSEYLVPLLVQENQKYRDVVVFSAGVTLNIPEAPETSYDNIPEWLQDASSQGNAVMTDISIEADDSDS